MIPKICQVFGDAATPVPDRGRDKQRLTINLLEFLTVPDMTKLICCRHFRRLMTSAFSLYFEDNGVGSCPFKIAIERCPDPNEVKRLKCQVALRRLAGKEPWTRSQRKACQLAIYINTTTIKQIPERPDLSVATDGSFFVSTIHDNQRLSIGLDKNNRLVLFQESPIRSPATCLLLNDGRVAEFNDSTMTIWSGQRVHREEPKLINSPYTGMRFTCVTALTNGTIVIGMNHRSDGTSALRILGTTITSHRLMTWTIDSIIALSNNRFATAHKGGHVIVRDEWGENKVIYLYPSDVTCMTALSKGRLALGFADGTVRILEDPSDKNGATLLLTPHTGKWVGCITELPQGYIATGSGFNPNLPLSTISRATVHLHGQNGALLTTLNEDRITEAEQIQCIRAGPEGSSSILVDYNRSPHSVWTPNLDALTANGSIHRENG